MKNRVLFFVFILCLSSVSFCRAQIKQSHRFEEGVKTSDDGFSIISLKREGLALIRDLDKYTSGHRRWQLEIVDSTLSKIWSTELELENRMILVGYEYYPGHLYLLFREGESMQYGFLLKTVLFHEKKIETDKIKFELDFRITHFTVAEGTAIFGGYVSSEPAVLLYNRSSDKPKVLPGLFLSEIKILDVRVNQNQSFNVLMMESKSRDNKKLIVRTYDHDANLILEDVSYIDPRFNIINGLTSALENDEMIITGTYGEGNNQQSIGIFSVVVDPFEEHDIIYTSFSALEHFLDYMPRKRSERIKNKDHKEKRTGNPSDYRAYVMPFRIEELNNEFYLLGEMYYSSHPGTPSPYNSGFYNPYGYGYYPYGISPYSTRNYNTPYSSSYPTSGWNQRMDGNYRMIQGLVVKINHAGKVVSDTSIKFEDVRQDDLEQYSDFAVVRGSITMIYKQEDEIFHLMPSGDSTITVKEKVSTGKEGKTIKNENRGKGAARFWFGSNLYIWGIEHVIEAGDKSQVFYINRISLDK